jgi:hypothetical protein
MLNRHMLPALTAARRQDGTAAKVGLRTDMFSPKQWL